jgi:hypothetical protein
MGMRSRGDVHVMGSSNGKAKPIAEGGLDKILKELK